ncbi:MAG: response regulator [Chthoniobacter sp.]|uniref:response regulator n=1 Tax=Chthoniobacter sp. TaxID=2510640 RepID=UPI0032A98317
MKTWPFSHRTKILAVDDECGFTRLLKLAASHYEIRTENDPLRALETAAEFQPDIILLDRFMPKISGDSLARSFEAHPKLHHIPIAFVTATVPRDDEGRFCTHLNGHPVLVKPVSIEEIDQCVRACVKP